MHLDYLWSIYSIKIKNKPFNKNVNCRGKGYFKKTKNNKKKFSLKKNDATKIITALMPSSSYWVAAIVYILLETLKLSFVFPWC